MAKPARFDPARRRRMADAANLQARLDGWTNLFTGAGNPNKDKTLSQTFAQRATLDQAVCGALYRQNWLAGRLVDDLVGDCTRSGFCLELAESDTDLCDRWAAELARLRAVERLAAGLRWSLVFRGAVGLLLTDDDALTPGGLPASSGGVPFGSGVSTVLAEPLPVTGVRAVRQILIVDARFALPDITQYDADPSSPNFGLPLYYQVTPFGQSTNTTSFRVHWTRLLRFDGVPTDALTRTANLTWGDSIYERAWDALRRYGLAFDGAAILASEIGVGTLKVRDLAANLGSDQNAAILTRAWAFKMSLGAFGMGIVDADAEEFTRQGIPMTGLTDLLDHFKQEIAGIYHGPASRLWGNQAGKVAGATEDRRLWLDWCHSWQQSAIVPQLMRLTQLLFASREGPTGGREPPGWRIVAHPIEPPDLDRELERRERQAKIDDIYFRDDVVEPREIRESRFGAAAYSFETTLDPAITERKRRAETEEPEPPVEAASE